jgi:chemotaxis protein histidine kinase CheA
LNLPSDPFILELLPEFVDSWIQDLDKFYVYKENNQVDELYRMAHTIKGSCYQFGINDLGDMGIELMSYAKIPDWTKSTILFEKIKDRFIEVSKFIADINK